MLLNNMTVINTIICHRFMDWTARGKQSAGIFIQYYKSFDRRA